MNELEFQNILKEKGIEVSEHQLQQFQKYYEILVEWNEKMNLTAITDKEDVYLKHFYDLYPKPTSPIRPSHDQLSHRGLSSLLHQPYSKAYSTL